MKVGFAEAMAVTASSLTRSSLIWPSASQCFSRRRRLYLCPSYVRWNADMGADIGCSSAMAAL